MARPPKESDDGKVPLMVRLPREVLDEARSIAEADDRTVNSYVVKAVREMNAREKKRSMLVDRADAIEKASKAKGGGR